MKGQKMSNTKFASLNEEVIEDSASCCGDHDHEEKSVGNTSDKVISKVNKDVWQVQVDRSQLWKGVALFMIALMVLSQLFSVSVQPKFALNKKGSTFLAGNPNAPTADTTGVQASVMPSEGVALPVKWSDIGQRMVKDGVIEEEKFRAIFTEGLNASEEQILAGQWNEPIVMNAQNSRFMLNMLWAFGLANKNVILEEGDMTNEQYGGAGNFASTGGWPLSRGEAMSHYSKHKYVSLTPEQQAMVERVSKGIFRPCCGNSTYFPDCNHGMAMLGLLQLMAANNVSEAEMYKVALVVNSFWFPQTYIDLAIYFQEQGVEWADVDPKLVLGQQYSSSQGYQQTRQQIQSLPQPAQGGGGCGV
jgi:hypothetical protein